MSTEEKLEAAMDALKRIKENDPGPAHHIAADALRDIDADEE